VEFIALLISLCAVAVFLVRPKAAFGKALVSVSVAAVCAVLYWICLFFVFFGGINALAASAYWLFGSIFACIAFGRILSIWQLFSTKARRAIYAAMIFGCAAALISITASGIYKESLIVVSDETQLDDYMPFSTYGGDRLVSLSEPASLHLSTEGLPILDGATALFPVYAAFAQATYPQREYLVYGQPPDLAKAQNEMASSSEIICSSSATAFEYLLEGYVDIAFLAGVSADQEARAEQMGITLSLTPVGREAFVFIVNENNPIESLTQQQIRDIYAGKIISWPSLGWNGGLIKAYQRPKDSGSQTALEAIMGETPIKVADREDVVVGMGALTRRVANYRNYKGAIGYTFRFYVEEMISQEGIKLLAIDDVAPTKENIQNGSYPFSGSFYAVTANRFGESAEKLARQENAKKLIEWILSPQGQELVEKTGYCPL